MCSCLCEVVGMPPMGACCPLGSPCHSLFQISLGSGGWQRTQLVTAGLTKLRSYLGFVNLGWRDRDHISVSSAQSGLARSRLQSRFRQLRVVAEAPIGQGQTQHLHVCVCVCVSASGGSRQCEGPQASTPPVLHKGIYESEVFLNHPLRASPTREGPAEDASRTALGCERYTRAAHTSMVCPTMWQGPERGRRARGQRRSRPRTSTSSSALPWADDAPATDSPTDSHHDQQRGRADRR